MSTTIDKLSIEITSSSTNASNGIDQLANSLEKLKNITKGGAGLTNVTNQLNKLNTAIKGIDSTGLGNLDKLVTKLQSLSTLPKPNISPILNQLKKIPVAFSQINALDTTTFNNKITEFTSALNLLSMVIKPQNMVSTLNSLKKVPAIVTELNNVDMNTLNSKLLEMRLALQPLSMMPQQNISGTLTQLRKLPVIFRELNAIDMSAFAAKILEVVKALEPLANSMDRIAAGFSSFPAKMQKVIASTNTLSTSNNILGGSYINLWAKFRMIYSSVRVLASAIAKNIKSVNDYIENVNLFNVSLGQYASEAKEYAETIGDVMGIDPSDWMRSQGIFMTLAKGFGVTSDRAYTMSKNLTQLGYDISSFYNISVEEAMQKLESGLAGELEPLRRIGYDLSQARLEATALALGIDKAVSSMTQAEKAELRYYAIMTQITDSHGDMARTLNAPANQLRVLKAQLTQAGRAIGSIFIPALNAVLPYVIAATKVLRILASHVAALVGFEMPEVDYSGISGGAGESTEAVGDTEEAIKSLKKTTMGFDELNIIDTSTTDALDDVANGFDFELPEYDFISGLADSRVNEIVEQMKEWLGITEDINSWSDLFETKLGRILTSVGLVVAGLLAWKLSTLFIAQLATLSTVIGLTLLIESVFATFQEGLSWESLIKGAVGGALVGLGIGFKLGGFAGAIGGLLIGIGVSLLVNGVTSMFEEGITWENVLTTVVGALSVASGILTTVKLFNKSHPTGVKDIDKAGKTISDVSTGTSNLTAKLKDLVKNLALGLVILIEVAAAAIIVVGAIWILGEELKLVAKAWQPVIDNGGTVAIAMGLGIGILAAIGVVTALLGSIGTTLIVNLALGIAMLALIGASAVLFIAEILVVGLLLDEVGKAWKPVLDNGDTIAKGIAIGTGLLIGIGVVTALLGVATVASAGLLPLAIGLGTAMLVELTLAFVVFTESLVIVAKQLSDDLAPALAKLSEMLPDLTTDMRDFTKFMGNFALEVVKYSASSAIAGIAATIDTIIDFFTTDPVERMGNEIDEQNDEFEYLIKGLEIIIPNIEYATKLVDKYNKAMGNFDESSGTNKGLLGNLGIVKSAINSIISGIERLSNGVIRGINGMINALNKLSFDVPDWVPAIGGKKFGLNLKTISEISIPRFEKGGFPETGQMFIAREAGAEMVGSIGRRTAVANNEQIVASVSAGVAEANSEQNALLKEQNALLRALLEKDNNVKIDGKDLTKSVEKYQRDRGRVLITGGAY